MIVSQISNDRKMIDSLNGRINCLQRIKFALFFTFERFHINLTINRFEKKKEFLFTLLTEWVRKCKKKLQIFLKKNCENPHPSQWIFFFCRHYRIFCIKHQTSQYVSQYIETTFQRTCSISKNQNRAWLRMDRSVRPH